MPKIASVKKQYQEILEQLSNPELISNWPKFEEFSRERARLEKIISKEEELKDLENKIGENMDIIKAREDLELSSLAETELLQLREKKQNLEKELESLLRGNSKEMAQSAIIEIRAGTGGDEASLFAADLYKMYSKYGQRQGWQQKILDCHPTELGGFKEIIFEMKGNVFLKMRHEAGVHRVQRIPSTEKAGRVHTSTASVAVLPKPKKTAFKIKPEELNINTYRASGPGGQYVNKRETAIRITHLPTGLVVTSQTERSQLQNKENALAILEVRFQEIKELQQLEKMGDTRKAQIKRAQRAEKVRTYNFPQDRLTDHRIKKSFRNLEEIMGGKLDAIIENLSKQEL
jgi:peptide chain release factor 1